jgi:CRISPR-associated protein Csm4
MKLYRIRFELCSSIITPLKGDTIWGHIVWGIANHEGNEAVEKFLEQEKSDLPSLVVSSAFPAGMLCFALPEAKKREGSLTKKQYIEIKKEKKKKYMPASDYFEETETQYPEMKYIKEGGSVLHNMPVMHNKINRFSNTVIKGGLYSTDEKWPGAYNKKEKKYINIDWDFYILSSFDKKYVEKLVKWAFENGYGADASTGKGKIEIKGDPVSVTTKKNGNRYMALGPFVGTKELKDIRADIFVRFGKLGGSFASGMSPHKKPVVLYDEGAVIECDTKIEYAGKLLENIHSNEKICQSGFAPVIPV